MLLTSASAKTQLEVHIQQWFAEPIHSITGVKATRLETLNLMQIARLAGLNQSYLRLFALGEKGLSLTSIHKLITVIEGFGYKPLPSSNDY